MKTINTSFGLSFILYFLICAGCSWVPVLNSEKHGDFRIHEDIDHSFHHDSGLSPGWKPGILVSEQKTQPNTGVEKNKVVPSQGGSLKSVEIKLIQRANSRASDRISTLQSSALKDQKYRTYPIPAPIMKNPPVPETGNRSTSSYHNEILTEDVTWNGRVFIKGSLTIAPQATLTIGSGTTVYFTSEDNSMRGGVLLVHGRVMGRATSDRPIIFRSYAKKGTAARWQGIVLMGSEKNNYLEHCLVDGAEIGLDAVYSVVTLKDTSFVSSRLGIRLQDSQLHSSGGEISKCDVGFTMIDSEVDIRNTVFSGNTLGLASSSSSLNVADAVFKSCVTRAIDCTSSKVRILNSKFNGNNAGISLETSEGRLVDNRIVNNRGYGLRLNRSRMRISGNSISRNSGYGILSSGGNSAVWGNNIFDNGKYDLYHTGRDDIRAMGNWWGTSNPAEVKKRIYDKKNDSRVGSVIYSPPRVTEVVMP